MDRATDREAAETAASRDPSRRDAQRGDWVRIHRIVLRPEERAPNLPADTRLTPFQLWMNGFLEDDRAAVGDEVGIRTAIGRLVRGHLVEIAPRYDHDFGSPQPELLAASDEIRRLGRLP